MRLQNNFVELNLTRDENRYSWNNFPYNPRRYVVLLQYLLFLGFGDAVDNSECWSPVISYVESQYEAFLEAETKVDFSDLTLSS